MSNCTHIELGCGLDASRVKQWLSDGITTCIGIDTSLSEKNESFEILKQAQKYNIIQDFFTINDESKKHLKEVDALEFFKTLPSSSVQLITADFFFNVIPFLKSWKIMRECKRVLGKNGKLLITTYEYDKYTPLLLWLNRFQVKKIDFQNPGLTNFMKLSTMYEDEKVKSMVYYS